MSFSYLLESSLNSSTHTFECKTVKEKNVNNFKLFSHYFYFHYNSCSLFIYYYYLVARKCSCLHITFAPLCPLMHMIRTNCVKITNFLTFFSTCVQKLI